MAKNDLLKATMLLGVLVLNTTACAQFRLSGNQPVGPGIAGTPKQECQDKYETRYLVTGSMAIGFGFLSGTAGVGTLGFKGNSDGSASATQQTLAITSLIVGLGSAVSTFLAGHYANLYNGC